MKIQWTAATELFNSRYRERGTEIYDSGGVLSLDWIERSDTSARIHSTVRGSQNQIYAQVILIKERSHFPDVQGDCSCPVGHNCKHVVAVIRAITQPELVAILQLQDHFVTIGAFGSGDNVGVGGVGPKARDVGANSARQ